MASFNVELDNKKAKNSNLHNLHLRITVNSKHARIKLNYSIEKKHYNPKPRGYKYIRSSHPKHAIINRHIDDKIQAAKNALAELEKEKAVVTASAIKVKLANPDSKSFIEFANKVAYALKQNNHFGNYKKYKTLIYKLEEFRNKSDILFAEITPGFLASFEAHLVKLGNAVNTINGNLRTIRAIYYKAIQNGIVEQNRNPFAIYKIKSGNTSKDRLTLEEIIKIEELEFTPGTLISHVKNVFLFSFYNAGIRISDLLMLTWGNIQNGRLVYTMYKTNRTHSLLLKEKPLAIMDQYRTDDTKKEDYIFPFFKNNIDYSNPLFLHNQIGSKTALINKYLKQIATMAEIDKNITTHTARHSFADIARKKEKNLYNLSKALGHSSIKVTEAYLASFDEAAVDETLNNVFD